MPGQRDKFKIGKKEKQFKNMFKIKNLKNHPFKSFNNNYFGLPFW